MKLMIASDIHGSAAWCERLLEFYREKQADRLLLLGDLLYHGPRNDLPEGYAPKRVIRLLNDVKNDVFCVRGNCEAEVDQMVLDFPVMADYCILPVGNRILYATHGHTHGKDAPPLKDGDLLLCGHTHIPACDDCGSFMYLNPGSVSIPKQNSAHSCMMFEDNEFTWCDLSNGEIYKRFSLE